MRLGRISLLLLLAAQAFGQAGQPDNSQVANSSQANVNAKGQITGSTQQVTVTASRTSISTSATASSVRILDSQQLEQSPGFTLDDRLRQVPGLELYRRSSSFTANPTTQGISLRGLGSTAVSRTLVLSDEVPMTDPYGGWIHWNELPRLAFSTVEVMRGGASDLYGSSAIGGVINEMPVRAEGSRAEIDGGYGNQQTGFGDGIWVGRVLPHNILNGLAAASIVHTAGYITTAPESAGPIDTAAGVHAETGRIELRHGGSGRDFFVRGNVLSEDRANGTPATKNGTRLWRYAGGFDQPVGDGRVFLRLYGSDQSYSQTFSTINTPRTSEYLNRFQNVPTQELGGSTQWAQTFGGKLTVVAGADVRDIRATDVETTYGSTGSPTGTTDISARQRDAGAYGELLWDSGPWSATLSGRVDNFQTFDVRKFVSSVASTVPSTGETVFDPRLGLVRRVGHGASLTGSIFRAFRGPTQNELYRNSQVGSQLTTAPSSNTLLSERATGFELGGEIESSRIGTLRASYFWTEVNRPVTALFVSTNLYQRVNLGQIRSRGLSLDYSLHPLRWLEATGGYQFAYATVTDFVAQPGQPSLVGTWIPEVARNAASLDVRVAPRGRWGTLNLLGRVSGRVFDGSGNQFLLHGYTRFDGYYEHTLGSRMEIYASSQNLLDRRIDAGRTPLLTLASPRTALIGLRIHLAR